MWALYPMTGGLISRGKDTEKDTKEGHVNTEAETEAMLSSQGTPGATRKALRNKKGFSPGACRGITALPTP